VKPAHQTAPGLPVARACELAGATDRPQWLIEGLWAEQAVGILGGEPKCCKSFLALDIAVSVASGSRCLRRFRVGGSGPVLLFPAEDSHRVVRQRLEGICAAADVAFDALPLYVITAPRLLLDLPQDRGRLRQTIAELRPVLLVLDPFIRLHRADENASKEVAPLLGFLRELQREFALAVLLVHHVRKRSAKDRPGQALRGSSDLHGWGDSNLYLRRSGAHLVLSVEHRAAPSGEDIALQLAGDGDGLALCIRDTRSDSKAQPPAPAERILQAMAQASRPLTTQQLRMFCRMRTTTLCQILAQLRGQGRVIQTPDGYALCGHTQQTDLSFPAAPIGSAGNGNRKCPHPPPLLSGQTQAGSAGTQPAQG